MTDQTIIITATQKTKDYIETLGHNSTWAWKLDSSDQDEIVHLFPNTLKIMLKAKVSLSI